MLGMYKTKTVLFESYCETQNHQCLGQDANGWLS